MSSLSYKHQQVAMVLAITHLPQEREKKHSTSELHFALPSSSSSGDKCLACVSEDKQQRDQMIAKWSSSNCRYSVEESKQPLPHAIMLSLPPKTVGATCIKLATGSALSLEAQHQCWDYTALSVLWLMLSIGVWTGDSVLVSGLGR